MLESVLPLWTDIWGSNLQWMDLLWSSTPQVLGYLTKNYSNLQTDRTVFPRWYFDMYSIIIDYIYQTYLPDIFTTYFPFFDLFWGCNKPRSCPNCRRTFCGAGTIVWEVQVPLGSMNPRSRSGVPSFQETSNWGIPCYRLKKKWWWTTDDSRRSKYWRSVETIVPRTPTETAAGGMNGSTVAVNSGKRPAIVALDSGKRPAILKARLGLRYLELCVAVTSFGWNMLT